MSNFPGKKRGKKTRVTEDLKSEVTYKRGETKPADKVFEPRITGADAKGRSSGDMPLTRSTPMYNWENKHILIAEDEELNYLYLRQALMLTKVKLTWARNGLEAVEFFRAHPGETDLLLIDLRMPEMDGYEAIVNIRKIDPKVPIIAQTAYTFTDNKNPYLKSSFDAILSKPIPPRQLLETLNKHLHR